MGNHVQIRVVHYKAFLSYAFIHLQITERLDLLFLATTLRYFTETKLHFDKNNSDIFLLRIMFWKQQKHLVFAVRFCTNYAFTFNGNLQSKTFTLHGL